MEFVDDLGVWSIPAIYFLHVATFIATVGIVSLSIAAFRRAGIGAVIESRPLRPNQVIDEMKWGLLTLLVMSVYVHFSLSFIDRAFPLDLQSAGVNLLIFVVAHDFYVYVTHRAFHSKQLWRFHRQHHRAIRATPWSSLSMHPVEAAVNYLPFLLFACFVPVSLTTYLGIYVYLLFGIVFSHSNYNLAAESSSNLNRSLNTFHQRHHSAKSGNFGLLYTHWDSIFGSKLPD